MNVVDSKKKLPIHFLSRGKMTIKKTGLILAAAAASMFIVGCATQADTNATPSAQAAPVAQPANSCKGMSSCKGMNNCKGKMTKKKHHHHAHHAADQSAS